MASQILRPTTVKGQKGQWLVQGPWGHRKYDSMSRVHLYQQLRSELIVSGVLPTSSPNPSNRYHSDVTMTICRSSWIDGRWLLDDPSQPG